MIQHYGQSLDRLARSRHRAWIGVRVEALLDGYWSSRPSEVVKDEILRDWMDGLDGFTEDEIRTACQEWLRESPRSKPRVGDISQIIQRKRGLEYRAHIAALPAPEPERCERVSPERADEIVRAAGIHLKRMV